MAKIFLKKNEDRRIRNGHLWVFSNEINNIENEPGNGELIDVFDFKNNFIGTGFFNKNSLIAVRLLSSQKIEDINAFLKQRLIEAFYLRKKVYHHRNSFRFAFSESDFLPGLIIDKYNNSFVLQVHSAGIEKNIDKIVNILSEEFSAENIFTKNEMHFRKLEGLPEEDEIYLGKKFEEIVDDGKLKFKINFDETHKTGFYFDQSDNRYFIEKLSGNSRVVDAFCNSGGFGMHAASAGAEEVIFVDSSASEIESAKQNYELNRLKNKSDFINKDVFEFLSEQKNKNNKYDVVIIDPPAFAKSKKNLPQAKKGYEKLNRMSMEIIKEGGYLVTSSCSHHLKKETFFEIINSAAIKLNKTFQQIYFNTASLDHPELPAMPETSYLKFGVYRVW